MILLENFAISIEIVPIKRRKWAGIILGASLWVVLTVGAIIGHSRYVSTACYIGFGGHLSAIGMHAHSNYIWNHYPVGSIDEVIAHPD